MFASVSHVSHRTNHGIMESCCRMLRDHARLKYLLIIIEWSKVVKGTANIGRICAQTLTTPDQLPEKLQLDPFLGVIWCVL